MLITTTAVRPFGLFDTMINFDGIDAETGDHVVFAVDHRPARELRALLEDQGEVDAEVEDWAILRRVSAAKAELLPARTDEALFRAEAATATIASAPSLQVLTIARYTAGDDSSYPSAIVVCIDKLKVELGHSDRAFSTHRLIRNDQTTPGQVTWYAESGNYDFDLEGAAANAKTR